VPGPYVRHILPHGERRTPNVPDRKPRDEDVAMFCAKDWPEDEGSIERASK